MCGILGELSNGDCRVDGTIFKQMLDLLQHRGPDDFGITELEGQKVVLGHRRLSIIDLSSKAHQPMSDVTGQIWLTFNGEIYNYNLLRNELIGFGVHFMSSSDTEVIIQGYKHWGLKELLTRIEGMFAFGIWDGNVKKLFLVRDRIGIKPLYYYQTSSRFVFSSELKSIVKNPSLKCSLDYTAIADYLVYRYIPAPKSVYKEVRKVMPGQILEYNFVNGSIDTKTYWSPSFNDQIVRESYALEKTKSLLMDSVSKHLVSDVEVGVFLSGGYDSGTLVHIMSELGYSTNTYTIGFNQWKRSEHEYARIIANKYSTTHTEKILSSVISEDYDGVMFYFDEPLGGASFLPTFEVSSLASNDLKVVLGGDGGDEVFGGYKWHYDIVSRQKKRQGLFGSMSKGKDTLLSEYFNWMNWASFSYSEVYELLNGNLSKEDVPSDTWLYSLHDDSKLDALKRLQNLDIKTFLPDVVLAKVDRASMAHSLEVRVPFLDHHLMDHILSLNSKHCFEEGVKKKMLFELIKGHLPNQILSKPKQGFGSPFKPKLDVLALQKGVLVDMGIISLMKVNYYIETKQLKKLAALQILETWSKEWLT